jgi:hypothetical protein
MWLARISPEMMRARRDSLARALRLVGLVRLIPSEPVTSLSLDGRLGWLDWRADVDGPSATPTSLRRDEAGAAGFTVGAPGGLSADSRRSSVGAKGGAALPTAVGNLGARGVDGDTSRSRSLRAGERRADRPVVDVCRPGVSAKRRLLHGWAAPARVAKWL